MCRDLRCNIDVIDDGILGCTLKEGFMAHEWGLLPLRREPPLLSGIYFNMVFAVS